MSFAAVLALMRRSEPWYDAALIILALVLIVVAGREPFRSKFFWPAAIFALFLARLPNMLTVSALQVDESAIMSNAMRALRFPIAWSGFDGFTSGPLDTYAMLPFVSVPPHFLYASVRFEGFLVDVCIVVFTYFGLRPLVGARLSGLCSALVVFFFVGSPHFELATFTTESLPIALFALAMALLVRAYQRARFSHHYLPVVTCLAGAMLFAKLQSAPLCVLLLMAALSLAFFRAKSVGQPSGRSLSRSRVF